MRDGTFRASNDVDVITIDADAVNEKRSRLEHAMSLEQRDARRGARRHGDATATQAGCECAVALLHQLTLDFTLRDVHRDGKRIAQRVIGDRRVQRVAHRIRRMRGNADSHEWRLAPTQSVGFCAELRQRCRALRRIGTEHFLIHYAADSRLEHRVERDARVAGVGIRGDTVANPLGESESRGVEHAGAIEHRALDAIETQDPAREVQILEKAAHQGELEVRVSVDEPGQQDGVAEVAIVAARRVDSRSDIHDPPIRDHDGAMLDRRRADGKHPSRVIADHDASAAGVVDLAAKAKCCRAAGAWCRGALRHGAHCRLSRDRCRAAA